VAQLRYHEDQFADVGARIVTISFGPAAQAPAWLDETESPFPLLIDARRDVYAAYGMRRSLRGSLSLSAIRRDRELRKAGYKTRGLEGDMLQLGGDVIVDSGGIVRLLRLSRFPGDAEPVHSVLHMLAELDDGSSSMPGS
jgi:hypothetical protein